MITISKHSINATARNISSGVFVLLCGILCSVLVLLPIDITYKLGFLAFITMVFTFLIHPLFAVMGFLFIRPSIEPLIDVQIVQGIPLVGFFTLWIIVFLVFKFLTDKTYTIAIPYLRWLLLLIPFSLFSMFNSDNLVVSVAYLLRITGWISIYILVYNLVKKRDDANKIIIILMLSSLIPLIVGYYQLVTHAGMIDKLRGINRVTSVFDQPDTCGVFFSMIFFITLIYYIQSKGLRIKITLSIAIMMILTLIIFTYHRASLLGLFAGVIIMSVFNRKMMKITIPLMLFMGIIFHDEISKRITEIFEPQKYTVSALTTRVELWKISIFKLIPEHPFIGCGIGMVDEAMKKYFTKMVPHNDYLRLAVEIGIMGMIVFVIFLLCEVRYYFSKIITDTNRGLNTIMLGLLIYFGITSFGQNNFYNVNNMAILFSMLAVSKKLNVIQMENRPLQTGLSH